MELQWADGFRAPKGIKPDQVWNALQKLPEPSPENLFEASKNKRHVLHGHLWAEGDQVWAQRARLEECRKIIGGIHTVSVHGGKTISVRAVEYVRPNGEGRWATLQDIRSDQSLLVAYLAEIERLNEQAAMKMARVRQLLQDTDET